MSEQPNRVRRAERALIEQFGDVDGESTIVSAPGRVNLIGGHTDYNEGFVLPTAIDRRTTIAARARTDDVVNAYSLALEERASTTLSDLEPGGDHGGWFDYVAGVFDRLRERDYRPRGVDLAIASDVPMGSGVSSSAALEVATVGTLESLFEFGLSDEEIATVARETENKFVGVSCGIMDQFAATFGEADSALFLDCRTRELDHVPFPTDEVKILVVDTTIQHDLVESAYNERVEQCQRAIEAFDRVLEEPVTALRDVSQEAFDEYASDVDLSETVRNRCRHVVAENERVLAAVEALESRDLEEVGSLMVQSHESLRTEYETSCAELDLVVDLATAREGVYGARMTGAGFGGSVVALVRSEAVDDVRESIREGYRDETGIDPEIYACESADGWREEPSRTAARTEQTRS